MSELRPSIRRTQTSGSIIYATVEAVAGGYATVRLAENGARLTWLPVQGSMPAVGTRVIVDYSAEGAPYVRLITEPTTADGIWSSQSDSPRDLLDPADATPADESVIPDLGLNAARLSRTRDQPFSIVWTGYSNTILRVINFDTVLFDPMGLSSATYGTLGIRGPGRFFYSWRVCIGPPPGTKGWYVKVEPYIYPNYYYIGGRRWDTFANPLHDHPFNGSGVVSLPSPEYFLILRVQAMFGSYPSTHYGNIVYSKGKYPILDFWKIANIDPAQRGELTWWPTS